MMPLPLALRDPQLWQKFALFLLVPVWLPLGVVAVAVLISIEVSGHWRRVS